MFTQVYMVIKLYIRFICFTASHAWIFLSGEVTYIRYYPTAQAALWSNLLLYLQEKAMNIHTKWDKASL